MIGVIVFLAAVLFGLERDRLISFGDADWEATIKAALSVAILIVLGVVLDLLGRFLLAALGF